MRTWVLTLCWLSHLLTASLALASLAKPIDSPATTKVSKDQSWSEQQRWATSYLFNAIFLYEYWWIKQLSENSQGQSREQDDKSLNLFNRASLAAYALAQNQQELPELKLILAKLKEELQQREKRTSAAKIWQINTRAHFLAALANLPASFEQRWQQKLAGLLPALYQSLTTNTPCPASQQSQPFCQRLARLEKSWRVDPHQTGTKARPPFLASPTAEPATPSQLKELAVLHAAAHLIAANFPAALGILIKLQASEPLYRLAYDKVQRLYSIQEKGSGQVALQGL